MGFCFSLQGPEDPLVAHALQLSPAAADVAATAAAAAATVSTWVDWLAGMASGAQECKDSPSSASLASTAAAAPTSSRPAKASFDSAAYDEAQRLRWEGVRAAMASGECLVVGWPTSAAAATVGPATAAAAAAAGHAAAEEEMAEDATSSAGVAAAPLCGALQVTTVARGPESIHQVGQWGSH
jgi:hypothetical protein